MFVQTFDWSLLAHRENVSHTLGALNHDVTLQSVSFRRLQLAGQLKKWHLKVIEIVKRGQHRKSLDKLFQGFKPAVESCYFNWEVAYPMEGITYCSADKKNIMFLSRTLQLQRGAKASAAGGMEPFEHGGVKGENADYKGRGSSCLSQQEVAVRPKETLLTKRKCLSVSGGGGMLVRLGATSLPQEDGGGKCMYKVPGSSSGGKMKLTQGAGKGGGAGGSGGGGGLVCGKLASAKRRTSSEDSSLEPDLADLSLDDGCSLALGAEASNTFEFLPAPPDMLPSTSPLLRDSHKYSIGGSKMSDASLVSGLSSALPIGKPAPPCCLSKETIMLMIDVPSGAEKNGEQPLEPGQSADKELNPAGSSANSMFATTTKSVTGETSAKKNPCCGEALSAEAQAGGRAANADDGVAAPEPPAAGEMLGAPAEGDDDYQAYYLGVAAEEAADKPLADAHQEEEPDIFAGIQPLEQEGRMEVGRCNHLLIHIFREMSERH